MNFKETLPIVPGQSFEVVGYFFNIQQGSKILGMFQVGAGSKLTGIGGRFTSEVSHENTFTGLFSEEYLSELQIFLEDLRDNNGQLFFSEENIKEIISFERKKEVGRGELAQYARLLVVSWLREGFYVRDIEYVGNIDSKHCFLVKSFLAKKGDDLILVTKKSKGRVKVPQIGKKLIFRDVQNVHSFLLKGDGNYYISLAQETLQVFFALLNEKERERIYNGQKFAKIDLRKK